MQSRDNFVQLFIILFSDKISNSCDFLIERQFLFSSTYCTIIFDRVASTKYRSISLVFRTQIACSIENVKCDVARTLNFFYTLFSTVHLDIYIYQNDHKCKVLIKN